MNGSVPVHPLAVVARGARIGAGVTVGPFAVVEDDVVVGDGCQLHGHAMLRSGTVLGEGNVVHPFAVLGGSPQDRRYDGEPTRLEIGNRNVFREHVTVHRGTAHGGGVTRIGSRGTFMAAVHVAHDCQVGDDVTLANGTLLGGHVSLADHVTSGGHVAIAPFVKVGACVFLAGGAMVERDVPPFVIAAGDRARVRALNRVGLERAGVSEDSRTALTHAFRRIFRSGSPRREAAADLVEHPDARVRELARFVRELR